MSSRDLPPELSAELAKPVLQPFLAVHIATPDPVYAWSDKGSIDFLGQTWTSYAGIGSLDAVSEKSDGSATGFKATLNKVPAEMSADLADQAVRGASFNVYAGALDSTCRNVLGSKLIWKGTLQAFDVDDGGDTLTVSVGGESRMIDQRRPTIKRFTDAWQQRKHAGDRFFEYVPKLVEIPILWAKASQAGI
ncbi:hypothetical protein BH09PSE4_BH09PSE4_18930 [soil metagenome]